MNDILEYIRVRKVHELTRGTNEAAGIDFYVPEYDEKFMHEVAQQWEKLQVQYEILEIYGMGLGYDCEEYQNPHKRRNLLL